MLPYQTALARIRQAAEQGDLERIVHLADNAMYRDKRQRHEKADLRGQAEG